MIRSIHTWYWKRRIQKMQDPWGIFHFWKNNDQAYDDWRFYSEFGRTMYKLDLVELRGDYNQNEQG